VEARGARRAEWEAARRSLTAAEGHHVEYDELGNVVGLVLLNVRRILDRDGELSLTWPPAHLAAGALEPALAVA
jgi:hypothetical protein